MARPKKQVKLKEPIKIRLKPLADGNKSIILTSTGRESGSMSI